MTYYDQPMVVDWPNNYVVKLVPGAVNWVDSEYDPGPGIDAPDVTEAMVDAGVAAMVGYHWGKSPIEISERDQVAEIYRAMKAAEA